MRLAVLALLLLTGCSGRPSWGIVTRAGSESRHNVQGAIGPRATWPDGTYAQVLGGHRWRVEDPSTRGDSEEHQIAAEVFIPVGR